MSNNSPIGFPSSVDIAAEQPPVAGAILPTHGGLAPTALDTRHGHATGAVDPAGAMVLSSETNLPDGGFP
jgi:hypothetical protein